jgi:hypothetical protein
MEADDDRDPNLWSEKKFPNHHHHHPSTHLPSLTTEKFFRRPTPPTRPLTCALEKKRKKLSPTHMSTHPPHHLQSKFFRRPTPIDDHVGVGSKKKIFTPLPTPSVDRPPPPTTESFSKANPPPTRSSTSGLGKKKTFHPSPTTITICRSTSTTNDRKSFFQRPTPQRGLRHLS